MNAANERLFGAFCAALAHGRMAHAYLLVGDPGLAAWDFGLRMAQAVYCEEEGGPCGRCAACRRIAAEGHPDVGSIEPQSKSRRILVSQIDEHIQRLQQTAYEGGCKVAMIRYADRLNEEAANKFLKTLEEPPGNSLVLLITDAMEALLPTIRSRCQVLKIANMDAPRPVWMDDLLVVLRSGRAPSPLGRLSQAGLLGSIVKGLEEGLAEEVRGAFAEDEEVDEKVVEARIQARVRENLDDVLRVMQRWYRDVMLLCVGSGEGRIHFVEEREYLEELAQRLELADCYRLIERVDKMRLRVERNFSVVDAAEAWLQ